MWRLQRRRLDNARVCGVDRLLNGSIIHRIDEEETCCKSRVIVVRKIIQKMLLSDMANN